MTTITYLADGRAVSAHDTLEDARRHAAAYVAMFDDDDCISEPCAALVAGSWFNFTAHARARLELARVEQRRLSPEQRAVMIAVRAIDSDDPIKLADIYTVLLLLGVDHPLSSTLNRGRIRRDHMITNRWTADVGYGSTTFQLGAFVTALGAKAAVEAELRARREKFAAETSAHPDVLATFPAELIAEFFDIGDWEDPQLDIWALPVEIDPDLGAPTEPVWPTWLDTVESLTAESWSDRAAWKYATRVHGDLERTVCPHCGYWLRRHPHPTDELACDWRGPDAS